MEANPIISDENITVDQRKDIDLDDCLKDEKEAKKLQRKTKLVYCCPICNKIFKQKGMLRDHLGSKYLCSQRVTIEYLRKSIKENESVTNMCSQLDELISEFYHLSELANNIEYVKMCKKILRRIKYRYRSLVFNVRVIAIHDFNNVHQFDEELSKYHKIISEIEQKYLLLLF